MGAHSDRITQLDALIAESQKQIVVDSLKDYSVISTQPVVVDPK